VSVLIQIQCDCFAKLVAEPCFRDFNIVKLREKLFESEVALATVWQTPGQTGKSGLGIVVGMPVATIEDADAPGPELCAHLPFIVLEEPNINQAITGTRTNCETVASSILRTLHRFALAQNLTVWADSDAISPNRDYEGIRGYNLKFKVRYSEDENPKSSTPSVSLAGDIVTLSTPDNGAVIWYTTDRTFPTPDNTTATQYSQPFTVASGTLVRVTSWLAGSDGSDCRNVVAP